MKDQREREDRERLEEVESYKKENKELKEKVNSLQIELTEKEVSEQRDFLYKATGLCTHDCVLLFAAEHAPFLCTANIETLSFSRALGVI